MLRKRSRTAQEESKMQFLRDLGSSSYCFSSDASIEPKKRHSSFFSISGFLVSFTGKGVAESDSIRSSTFSLDHRLLSNLANSSFRSQKFLVRTWDCSTVGLGLVNSPRDETKNILLASQMRVINIPKSQLNSFGNEPKQAKDSSFWTPGSSKLDLETNGKISSCSVETGTPNFDLSSIELVQGFMDSLSASEDYTCIKSHGPNPKTTHIFGEFILGSAMIESQNSIRKEGEGRSHWIVKNSDDFLSFCCFCSMKLEEGRDIFMYRGKEAFCSCICRDQAILFEEESSTEKRASYSCDSICSSSFNEELFMEGLAESS